MIEKMAYVSVTGPKDDFDRIIDEYLSRYEMQLENSGLSSDPSNGLAPFSEENPYQKTYEKALALCEVLKGDDSSKKIAPVCVSAKEAAELVDEACLKLNEFDAQIADAEKETAEINIKLAEISPFAGINYDLGEIFSFSHVVYRFGRIPKDAYNDYKESYASVINAYFAEGQSDDRYLWGVYFASEKNIDKTDAAFASYHFERIDISHDYSGTPEAITASLNARLKELEKELGETREKKASLLSSERDALFSAKTKLEDLFENFDAHSYAVLAGASRSRFILSAWMVLKDAEKLAAELKENEKDADVFINRKPPASDMTPPTKIRNRGPFKPFEMYTKMYGLPAYGEFDPTWFVAITYSFIFGAMFGDLGQGLVLMIGGALLYFCKKTHPMLPGIISCAGFFSAIFGLLFGSFFGFEDIIPALWLKPKEAMVTLNFIGRINTVFAIAVAFGMIYTIVIMCFNIYNGFKQKDFSNCLFGSNGIAGIVFYAFLVAVVFLYMSNRALPATIIIILMVVIPLLIIGLNEPLVNLMNKKKPIEGGIGMFCLETFFDLFEICLSYFSNTLSFVRIGAFAVSHAAMMEVVLQLTGYDDGSGSILGLILGNIIVIGFEGLIVGIQVLRLEYYETFSKFYKGTGREFKPFFKRRAI